MRAPLPPNAVKSDGTKVPQEPALGALLVAGATYYFDCSMADETNSSVHIRGDAAIVITSAVIQDSNLPPYKGAGGASTDIDSGVDVSLYDATAGNWFTEDPATAYVPVTGSGWTVANMTVASTGSAAGGAMFNIGNLGSRRQRLKVVVGATGGYLRVQPHGKMA